MKEESKSQIFNIDRRGLFQVIIDSKQKNGFILSRITSNFSNWVNIVETSEYKIRCNKKGSISENLKDSYLFDVIKCKRDGGIHLD